MQVVKEYPDGLFNWVDLATTDMAGAKAFYSGLFGWEAEDLPTDVGAPYTMFKIEGHNVAGMSAMPPEMQAQGIPPIWSSYIKHNNADEIAAKAETAGATIMMPPMDVMDAGRMMFAQDPTGAMFGVWQPNNHIGAQLVNQPNTLVWNELNTRDAETSKAFYETVFGWTTESDPNGYGMFQNNGRTQAGLLTMDESFGDMPTTWMVYFFVEDVNAASAKVKELGGNIVVPATPAGELGHFSVVQDPQGGTFTIMQFSGPIDPPPGY
ncbi:MAG: VOC family protein [Chloroflexi bacterium]|nr:VOC family protein [Chloroflexota bacterium]